MLARPDFHNCFRSRTLLSRRGRLLCSGRALRSPARHLHLTIFLLTVNCTVLYSISPFCVVLCGESGNSKRVGGSVMKRTLWSGALLLVLAALLGLSVAAWGQEVTASIVGTVSDPSGAPINGADVKATSVERGNAITSQDQRLGPLQHHPSPGRQLQA